MFRPAGSCGIRRREGARRIMRGVNRRRRRLRRARLCRPRVMFLRFILPAESSAARASPAAVVTFALCFFFSFYNWRWLVEKHNAFVPRAPSRFHFLLASRRASRRRSLAR